MRKIIITFGVVSSILMSVTSCRDKDLEPTLAQFQTIDSIRDEAGLKAFLGGAYIKMRSVGYLGRDVEIYGEVRTDNTYASGASGRFVEVAGFLYGTTSREASETWFRIYETIGRANFIINKGIEGIEGDKMQLKHYLGEAYAIRALAHFDLLRLFGQQYVEGKTSPAMNAMGIPYVKFFKGDPNNENPARNTVQEVYDNAKKDFEKAVELMDESKESSRNYITKAAAYGLFARMALYLQKYEDAKKAAKHVIDLNKYKVVTKDEYIASWKAKPAVNVIFSLFTNADTETLGIDSISNIYRKVGQTGYGDVQALGNLYKIFDPGDIRISPSMASKPSGAQGGTFLILENIQQVQDRMTSLF